MSSRTDAVRPTIAVLRAGALGDFLLSIPALSALRGRFPAAHIILAGPLPQARFALAAGVADELLSIDDPALAPLFDETGALARVPDALRSLSAAVVWLGRRETVAANLRRLGASQVVAAPPYSTAPGAPHVADWLLGTLAPLGVHAGPGWEQTPWLAVPDEARAWAEKWRQAHAGGKEYVLLHPGSGSHRKNWPAQRWAEVVSALQTGRDFVRVVTAGPAEDETLPALLGALGGPQLPPWPPSPDGKGERRPTAAGLGTCRSEPVVVRGLDLFQLAALVEGARLYLGNDSGVTHLAAGLGTPAVAIFGPTNPDLWHPRGPRVRVLGGNRAAGIGAAPLIAGVANWPEPGEVIEAAKALLHRTSGSPESATTGS